MQEVKRYCWGHHGMDAYRVGKYVLYTDAVKMQREAFVAGADWMIAPTGPEDVEQANSEADRRYKEE